MFIASGNASVLRTRFAQPDSLLRFGIGLDGIATGAVAVVLLIAAKWLSSRWVPRWDFRWRTPPLSSDTGCWPLC